MDRAAYVSGSYVGQGVVSKFAPDLIPDGKWGRFTQSRYEALRSEQRFAVDAALRAIGTSARELLEFRERERVIGVLTTTDKSDVKNTVRKAAMEAGIDADVALAYAKIESNFGQNTGGPGRRRMFPRGYHGLMQMGASAWADARRVDPSIGPFTVEAAYDDLTNARAAMAFAKSNIRVARKLGWTGVVDATALYLMHQQGAAGFVYLWSKKNGVQTNLKPSFTIPTSNLTGNPPQDKRGATADPVQFFTRWDAVVRGAAQTA